MPRKTVTHGWTAQKQRDFIAGLADTGSVRLAAEGVGMSHTGVYKLRHTEGGESFARAWDIAAHMGAKRIRDVLLDHAIHGIPETVIVGKKKIERRRFNHRTMIWALQHHLPEEYPGGSTLARKDRQLKPWQKFKTMDEVRESILTKLRAIERQSLREIVHDPAKRAAYDLLNGDHGHDWDEIAAQVRRRSGTGE